MKETSWRTLMLLTMLLAVFVIFQGTVRSPRLPVAQAQPAPVVQPRADPNKLPKQVVRPRPAAVEIIIEAPSAPLDEAPADPNEPNEPLPAVPE